MTQKVPNKMDKIKGDTFVDVYLIGSIKSLNIRVDHRDKKSLNIIKKNIGIKLPSIQKAKEKKGLTLCWVSNDEYLLLNQKKENDMLLNEFQKQMNLTTGVAENTTDLRVWFLIKGNRALDIMRKGVPIDLENSKVSESNFLRTRLGEIQVNILVKSLDKVLVSVLRSHKYYMIEWFEVCSKRGTEINFDL
jgi:heterotetrameric sarcosine oxidase gamma subunit